MADGRARHQWSHTSSILAMLGNVAEALATQIAASVGVRREARQFQPNDFNPFESGKKRVAEPDMKLGPKETMRFLKGFFDVRE